MSLYAYARIGRAGLGNSLLPWARAELFAARSGACMLAPRWTHVRLGPYLRREPDKRRYSGFFRAEHHTGGLSAALIAAIGRRIGEAQADAAVRPGPPMRPRVVEFRGLGDLFTPIAGEHEFIRSRLWRMTVAALRASGGEYGRFIAMHVRRGDLTRQGFPPHDLRLRVAQFTPISWFASMARAVRLEEALRPIPLVVLSDGTADELADLLAVDGVHLHARQPAISDLWTLAHADLLLASGFSTFSMWASYLGGMPTIYAPGKIQQNVQAGRPGSVEIELAEGARLPAAVLAAFAERGRARTPGPAARELSAPNIAPPCAGS